MQARDKLLNLLDKLTSPFVSFNIARAEEIHSLIQQGASLDDTNDKGKSVFELAAKGGLNVVQAILGAAEQAKRLYNRQAAIYKLY